DPTTAPRAYRRLQGALLNSPDLIETDRDVLMASYLALYEKHAKALGVGAQAALTRGRAGGSLLLSVAEQAAALRAGRQTGAAERLEGIAAAAGRELSQPVAEPEHEIVTTARRLRDSLSASPESSTGVAEALFRSAL